MGTSASSRGAPSGVPLVPPWVADVAPANGNDGNAGEQASNPQPAVSVPPVPIAPRGRFGPARNRFGEYASSGSSDAMRRGLGHYIAKGLGGARTAARRFGGTASTAGTLYGALSSAAIGQPAAPGSPFDPALLAGRTAGEIMDAVVEAVRPTDGTQDTEASRLAIRQALSDLLNRFPDANLLNLLEDERVFAIERYIALDIFHRFCLDVGKTIQDKAPTVTLALRWLKEVKDYVKEAVSAAFRRVRAVGQSLNALRITQMARQVLSETFRVFEDFAQ